MSRYGSASPETRCSGRRRGCRRSETPRPTSRGLRAFSPSPDGVGRSRTPMRQAEDASPPPVVGSRRRRRRADLLPRARSSSAGGGRRRRHRDAGDDRDRSRDRRRGKRHRLEKQQREYMKQIMAAQQNPAMRMAMMQGMMNPAMQMAMMQQMGYMQAMQGLRMPLGMPPFGMPLPPPHAKEKKRAENDGARAGTAGSGSSSNGESASGDTSGDDAQGGVPSSGPAGSAAVLGAEAFLSQCPVDPEAADRFRGLAPHIQQAVMARGAVTDSRNPSAVLIARIRDAELGRGVEPLPPPPAGPPPDDGADDGGRPVVRKSAKSTIEDLISEYQLSPGCAWMMRALPPDRQKLAAKIDPSGQSDPSGYVAEQLKKII
eukprot:SRR837773.18936.p1 GENE.SRR837773.18936~~SRR837773.18936.p1  ORF type:complete len:374 (-),score=12.12 SRR837773.18936:49-1170(-)